MENAEKKRFPHLSHNRLENSKGRVSHSHLEKSPLSEKDASLRFYAHYHRAHLFLVYFDLRSGEEKQENDPGNVMKKLT